jgi:pimeloyl-ACP methyl ester carboxylesterase
MAPAYCKGPSRLIFEETDPRGHAELVRGMSEHSAEGSALTLLGVQARRPSLYDLEAGFRRYSTPALILCGDEDDATLEPGLFLKRVIPTSGLAVLPKCGHTQNLEEPDLFNRLVLDFITRVDAGRWPRRIPESQADLLIAAAKA